MELTRIIHPIGQGGFYSEKLIDEGIEVNVIFDCGGNTQKSMESYLEYYFPVYNETKKKKTKTKEIKTIDAVFISHMHEDHINGLDYLLTHFDVRYLILPQLSEDEIYEAFLYNYFTNPETDCNSLIQELYLQNNDNNYPGTTTRIIKVPRSNGDEPKKDNKYDENEKNNYLEIKSDFHLLSFGDMISFNAKWVFIPFNPPANAKFKTKKGNFRDHLKKALGIDNKEIKELPKTLKRKRISIKKCKEVYTKYFGKDHNAYSMTLFSGATRPTLYKFYKSMRHRCPLLCHRECIHCSCSYFNHCPNILYMGDFDTNKHFDILYKFYKRYWPTISSLQVPHHGSHYNHNPKLYNNHHVKRGYISAGEKNKYNHPNIDTLIGIKEMECEPIIVTENMSTIKLFHATDN